tara:strand:+ start:2216 stop:2434 length:219 start_codon:yes stop_codon:yes gene_type:complete
MKIIQREDGGGEFLFEKHEIKILNEKKKLILDGESMAHMVNTLGKIAVEFAASRPDHLINVQSNSESKINGK